MALSLFEGGARKRRDQMLAVDLGGRITKAVHVQRRGNAFVLDRYALFDAPLSEKRPSAELLGEHLQAVNQAFESKCKWMALTVGVNDAVVRHVELPAMPVQDIRSILKNNSRAYLQQDLTGHSFDCHVLAPAGATKADRAAKDAAGPAKQKVLVAGAKQELVEDFLAAAKGAGLVLEHIVPGVIGPVNAFELALPDVFAREAVALVDIGFKSSSVSILQDGQLILNRVVSIGGDRLTAGLAEAMNISYAEAEGIKVGMPHEVQSTLEPLLMPLGRELRASIDFFEHQQDRPVSQVYLSGGSSRSEFIAESLRRELMVDCKAWNPAAGLKLALSPEQTAEIEQVAPQLTVAIGAAVTAL